MGIDPPMTPLSRRVLHALAAIGGVLLFAVAVRQAGVDQIVDGVRRVGWGLLAIFALGGARFMLRAECWRQCLQPGVVLRYRHALTAFLAGDAVGSVTPLGLVASEPTKVFLTRHHLATRESVSSLALENLVYAVSVVAMVAIGIVVLLATVPLPLGWQEALLAALAVAAVGVVILARVMRHGAGNALPRHAWRERLSAVRQQLHFASAAVLTRVLLLDLVYHGLAVIEVFLTLELLLGDSSPTLSQSVVFEALNRVNTVVFKFVPFRVGVDEALNGALAPVLTLPAAAGVTLAVVRKVRSLFWAGIGLLLVAAHPASSGLPPKGGSHVRT
ncbi:MAG: lysylphosphatidylglycerol synthase domain-containing protein [Vicinamibacterales bacterium]